MADGVALAADASNRHDYVNGCDGFSPVAFLEGDVSPSFRQH